MLLWIFLFIVAVSSVVPLVSAEDDKFIFSTTIECNYHDDFQYSMVIQFLEKDTWFSNVDKITRMKYQRLNKGKTELVFKGSLDGDEWLSNGYEVFAKIWHKCTEDKDTAELTLNLYPVCEVGKKICHYTFSRDITNLKGTYSQYGNLRHD